MAAENAPFAEPRPGFGVRQLAAAFLLASLLAVGTGDTKLTGRLRLRCGRLAPVGKDEELRLRILQGRSDANVRFDELRHLLQWLGFVERVRGSHHIFRRPGVTELINLQREGSKAKVYQVRQVRQVILRYGLEGEEG